MVTCAKQGEGVKNSHAGVRSGASGRVEPVRCGGRGAVPRLQSDGEVGEESGFRAAVPASDCACSALCAIWWTAIRSAWRCCTERSSCRTRRRRRGGCGRARRARRARSRRSGRRCALISRIWGCVGETGRASCADFGIAGRSVDRGACRRGGRERGRRRRRAGGNPCSALKKGGMERRSKSVKQIRHSFLYSYPYIDAIAF